MISFSPIWAITLRHLRLYKHDLNLLLMILYWPLLDILTWGFLGTWIQGSGGIEFQNYELVAILGVLLWQVAGRGANAISFALCEELWQNNVTNLFSLPITIYQWIWGAILYFTIIVLAIGTCSIICVYALYKIALLPLIYNYLLFFPPLFLCGIWLGFICLHVIVLLGKRGIELGFVIIWFMLPFSGAYYPITVLPKWGQYISSFFPMSYIFTGMREYVVHRHDPTPYLIKGYALSILYVIIAIWLFIYFFNMRKNRGLARLAD